jgi:Fe-S cluster biosynthesis and repair protein YggX
MQQIKEAILNVREKKLNEMKNNIRSALNGKAVQKLEERKIVIAKSYFGQK